MIWDINEYFFFQEWKFMLHPIQTLKWLQVVHMPSWKELESSFTKLRHHLLSVQEINIKLNFKLNELSLKYQRERENKTWL